MDPEKFEKLCQETSKIYFEDESTNWYRMPATMHKILVHGSDIIRRCPIPIGLTSEEPSEANNKVLRYFRMHHTRKTSWQHQMEDMFHRLLCISDPVIQECIDSRRARQRARRSLPIEIRSLLQESYDFCVNVEDEIN